MSINSISIYYQNARGLCTKTRSFSNNLLTYDYDIVAITETWLKDGIHSSELFHNSYTCLRRDRNDGRKAGGVLVAVHNTWSYIDLTDYTSPHEFLFLKLCNGNLNLFICCLYIPPKSKVDVYKTIFDSLESTGNILHNNVIIIGDFNLPDYKDEDFINNIVANNALEQLKHFTDFNNLRNFNSILNFQDKTLDLVLSNTVVNVFKIDEPLVVEDKYHPALQINVNVSSKKLHNMCPVIDAYNFRRANFIELYSELSNTDWSQLVNKDVNKSVELFYNQLYKIMDNCIPKLKKSKNSYPCWFTLEMIRLSKNKKYHFKKMKNQSGDILYHESTYKDMRRKLKYLIKQQKAEFIKDAEQNISKNINSFWSYIKSKKSTANCATFRTVDNIVINKRSEIANNFAHYFSTVYDHNMNDSSQFSSLIFDNSKAVSISLEDVKESINKLLPKKSCGPDFLPPYILKGCIDVISTPLQILYNLSLEQKVFPNIWKLARVCPVYKSGDKSLFENYRPVSILSSPAKVFEQIMYKYVYNRISSVITPYQHGFVPSKSTTTNLLNITNFINNNIELGKQTDVLYLDMSKAFDKIKHISIIKTLNEHGITPHICKWFESYLRDRQQYVEYDGFKSAYYKMHTGVPQGSNLGPLLFLLTVNEVPSLLDKCHCLMFADDIKLYYTISGPLDCLILEKNLQTLQNWCQINGLHLNVKKCKMMSYGRKQDIVIYPYKLGNQIIERVDVFRDLGVLFDSKLTFGHHIQHVVSQAYKNLGFILRMGYEFKDCKTYSLLYNTLVRSKLEYASVIWSPYTNKDIVCIEQVQKRFVRVLEFRLTKVYPKFAHYDDLLSKYGIVTLESRRNICSLLYLHKIVNNIVHCPEILAEIGIKVPNVMMRLRNNFFCARKLSSNYSRMSPIPKMILLYNSLLNQDAEIDIFDLRLSSFKNRITLLTSI